MCHHFNPSSLWTNWVFEIIDLVGAEIVFFIKNLLILTYVEGQRLYMVHMLLLPFLPITALIVQNSGVLIKQLQYQREVTEIGRKVDEIKILEKFITNLQSERAEVAFYIFTNGSQTLEMNLTTRYKTMIGI